MFDAIIANPILCLYGMIVLLWILAAFQLWDNLLLRRRVRRIERAFADVVRYDEPPPFPLHRNDLNAIEQHLRTTRPERPALSRDPLYELAALIGSVKVAGAILLVMLLAGPAAAQETAPAQTPAQVLQDRSTAIVAQEIGQLMIERAQLRASVELLREALAKSDARVKELEGAARRSDSTTDQ